MSQNKELNSEQTENKEVKINRVLCYLDSQIPLRLDVLEKFFTKKLSAPTVALSGRLDQRNFLQQVEHLNTKDFFVFLVIFLMSRRKKARIARALWLFI